MGFPVEAPQPHDHAQVPPGAPQEPSMQVSVLFQQRPFVSICNSKLLNKGHETSFLCVLGFFSAPPAVADGACGAERNPCWTHDPQIHLWQFGSTLPVSSKRSGKPFLGVCYFYQLALTSTFTQKTTFVVVPFQQTKRKLDDSAKRLGYLYDKLREQSVRI